MRPADRTAWEPFLCVLDPDELAALPAHVTVAQRVEWLEQAIRIAAESVWEVMYCARAARPLPTTHRLPGGHRHD